MVCTNTHAHKSAMPTAVPNNLTRSNCTSDTTNWTSTLSVVCPRTIYSYNTFVHTMCNIQLTCRCWAETVGDKVWRTPIGHSINSHFNIGVGGLAVKGNWRHCSLVEEDGEKRRQTFNDPSLYWEGRLPTFITDTHSPYMCMPFVLSFNHDLHTICVW